MPPTDDRALALELHGHYLAGESLREVGKRVDRSHEWVRQLFEDYQLPLMSAQQRRSLTEAEVGAARERIFALYREHGTIDAVADGVALPRELVAAQLADMPDRERYRRKGTTPEPVPLSTLLADLRTARAAVGDPMTATAYREYSQEHGLTSITTQIKTFDSWQLALEAIGAVANVSQGGGPGHRISTERCIEAVAQCIREHDGKRVSFTTYRRWALDKDVPSGSTARNALGSWGAMLIAALDKVHDSMK